MNKYDNILEDSDFIEYLQWQMEGNGVNFEDWLNDQTDEDLQEEYDYYLESKGEK